MSIFLFYVIGYIVRTDVLPALQSGTLSITSSTMILNRAWDGNELYVLLSGYVALACGLAYAGFRLVRR